MKSPRFLPILSAAGLISLCFCSGAWAAPVTIGSPLSAPPEPAAHCQVVGGCSVALLKLAEPGAHALAPISGAIVRWRVKGASAGAGYALSVLRPAGPGHYIVTAGTPAMAASGAEVETFPADLPIEAGELIAVSYPYEAAIASLESPSTEAFFTPALAIGQTRAATEEGAFPYELGFDAEVQPAPTIASLGPTSGPAAGGTEVGITGTDLEGATAVDFGALPAAGFSVVDEGRISARAPASPTIGPVAVSVTTPAGTAAAAGFTYLAPVATPPPSSPGTGTCRVPKLRGKGLKAARKGLRAGGCRLGSVKRLRPGAKGAVVVGQSPRAGRVLAAGSSVKVRLK